MNNYNRGSFTQFIYLFYKISLVIIVSIFQSNFASMILHSQDVNLSQFALGKKEKK